MKKLLKNCLLVNKQITGSLLKQHIPLLAFLFAFSGQAQIINYVNNPSFEDLLPTYTINATDAARYWGPIDSIHNSAIFVRTKLLGTVPNGFGGYQVPRTGDNFIGTTFYCDPSTCPSSIRWHPRNRLKQVLKPNTVYCAKYYLVNTNNCPVGIDSYGIHLDNNMLDTIKYCSIPLTYLNPQVENQTGIITDTLNWIPITGTFVANGTEKYMVLGNFRSNAATSTLIINPTFLPSLVTDVLIDDVSLIELELPAFAGHDTTCIPGTSVYIGRTRDVGIDEACMWYKFPDMSTAIDTAAGLWVSPSSTSTYIVRQEICGNVKWDTVVVYEDAVGIQNSKLKVESLKVVPVPADDYIELIVSNRELLNDFKTILVFNSLGQKIREEEFIFSENTFKLKTEELRSGAYLLQLKSNTGETVSKRFIISR